MLSKLRLKFIALNMATVAVVLAVVFTFICVIDQQQSIARVHEALDAAVAHAGDANVGASPFGSQMPGDATREGAAPPEIGGKRGGSDPSIPVAVFSMDSDGALAAVQARTTASLADDVLAQAAEQLADVPEGFGSLDGLGLFYAKRVAGSTAYLAFADMSAANGWQALALTLAGVGMAAFATFLVINVFFSRWALRPVERAWAQQRRFVADASHD